MLAYVFWHRPRHGVGRREYEEAQRAFQRSLGTRSACFRLAALPFAERDGYEDWYLVEDWSGLGELNALAVDAAHRPGHDAAAALAGEGWGGVYALIRGEATIPAGAEWLERPRGVEAGELLAPAEAECVWQRQLVLGPAPELCLAGAPSPARAPVWPAG
jgi:hypothetical protein